MTQTWNLPPVPQDIPHGDMPGDKICISAEHIAKAGTLYPRLREEMDRLGWDRADILLANDGTREQLHQKAEALAARLLAEAERGGGLPV